MRNIGLIGTKGSGKSFVADHLVAHHNYTLHKFAAPLKNMLRAIGLTEAEIEGPYKETPCVLFGGETPRYAMQTLGTEWGRDTIDPDLWTNAWRRTLPPGLFVCDDVRFENEAELLRANGGRLICITHGADSGDTHSSENWTGLVPDATVHNNKDPQFLLDIGEIINVQ